MNDKKFGAILGCGSRRDRLTYDSSGSGGQAIVRWTDAAFDGFLLHVDVDDNHRRCNELFVRCDLGAKDWRFTDCYIPDSVPGDAFVECALYDSGHQYMNFAASAYDEIHAYEVLEHLGNQGDYVQFFDTFYNIWSMLKPGGLLLGTCPSLRSPWLWGDPGHRRVIQRESLVFLNQPAYSQIGNTSMSDYRRIWHGDFDTVLSRDDGTFHTFVLKAVKPSRLKSTT